MTDKTNDSPAPNDANKASERTIEKRVTGIRGVFFRANSPGASSAWYQQHLGIAPDWEHARHSRGATRTTRKNRA